MSYEIYRYIFIGAAILCGAMLITSILLFILLKIPKVIGDLTGRTARKAIENIRNQNESSGDKTYRSSLVNQERGKLTDKISPSGRLIRNPTDLLGGAMATEKIGTQQLVSDETTALTGELVGGNETTVLDNAVLGETLVLSEVMSSGETTVLSEATNDSAFTIEYEITFIHTNEIITMEAV